jgi:hypothetical protein
MIIGAALPPSIAANRERPPPAILQLSFSIVCVDFALDRGVRRAHARSSAAVVRPSRFPSVFAPADRGNRMTSFPGRVEDPGSSRDRPAPIDQCRGLCVPRRSDMERTLLQRCFDDRPPPENARLCVRPSGCSPPRQSGRARPRSALHSASLPRPRTTRSPDRAAVAAAAVSVPVQQHHHIQFPFSMAAAKCCMHLVNLGRAWPPRRNLPMEAVAVDAMFQSVQGDVRDVWLNSVIPWLSHPPVTVLAFGGKSLRQAYGGCGHLRAVDLKQRRFGGRFAGEGSDVRPPDPTRRRRSRRSAGTRTRSPPEPRGSTEADSREWSTVTELGLLSTRSRIPRLAAALRDLGDRTRVPRKSRRKWRNPADQRRESRNASAYGPTRDLHRVIFLYTITPDGSTTRTFSVSTIETENIVDVPESETDASSGPSAITKSSSSKVLVSSCTRH